MKKQFAAMILLFTAFSFLVFACTKVDDDSDNDNGTRSASFKIGSTTTNVLKPYLGIFNDNGTIKNTMTLTAEDGSKIVFNFTGNSSGTYSLQSYSDAHYKDKDGKQYNPTSGELIVSSYSITDNTYKASGTFHFKAAAISTPIDSLEIIDGVFTNASNEL